MTSSRLSPTTSTTISEMTVRMIFLRVSGVAPGLSRQILAQHHEAASIRHGERLRLFGAELVEFGFEIAHHDQALVPTSLQFASYEPIVRIGRIILTLSPGRLIAGLLKCEFELSLLLRAPMTTSVNRRQGRLHTQGLEAVQHLLGDHPVGAHSAEANATGCRQVSECTDALVACGSIAVADTKLSSAPRAAENTDQQSLAATNGAAAHEPFAVGVVSNQGLIPLEVGPRNIALVMIRDQNAPASPVALHAA